MSFDHLQSLIKTTKCPLAVELSPTREDTPDTFLPLALALTDALRGTVPALRLSLGSYTRLGWQGMKALEELLAHAKELGLFTILDAPLWTEGPSPLSGLSADCLTVSGYLGSDALKPLLDEAKKEDKCLFVLARTANSSAGELQELVAGDRLVYQVVGDLAQRLGKDDLGRLGYNRMGVAVQGVYPSDLRSLRKRWEQSFLLVSGPAGDARYAFDQYGRGAVVSVPEPLLAARGQGGDLSAAAAAAKESAAALRDEWKQFVTVL